jgi:hypothetical protein
MSLYLQILFSTFLDFVGIFILHVKYKLERNSFLDFLRNTGCFFFPRGCVIPRNSDSFSLLVTVSEIVCTIKC